MEFDFEQLIELADDKCELLYGEIRVPISKEHLPEHADIVEYERSVYLDKLAEKLGYQIECVEQHGGEGQGDSIWAVFEVTSPDQVETYYKCHGYYASYHGADYNGCRKVEPKRVTRVEYE